jgi:hypothetical protein
MARIGELRTTLAITSNRRMLRRNTISSISMSSQRASVAQRFLSPCWWRCYVPPKRRFLQEPNGVTSQKTIFFIVTAVETSNLTSVIGVQNYWIWGLRPSSGILNNISKIHNSGRWTDRQMDPVILSAIHHGQNLLESTMQYENEVY